MFREKIPILRSLPYNTYRRKIAMLVKNFYNFYSF
jgi:hypothetical protein